MTLIGLLHQRNDPRTVRKAYYYAMAAKAENVELIYFTPQSVDFDNHKINGLMYVNGGWRPVQRRFPDVIYNAGSPAKLANYPEIINRLKKEIPFTTHSVGHKMSVYRRLKAAETFSDYLIPSISITSIETLFDFMSQHPTVVFKPIDGHKGQGVTFIEKYANHYLVKYSGQQFSYTQTQLDDFVQQRLKERQYLAQPYINSRTQKGIPFDLRLHVQKNGQGEWIINLMYARLSRSQSIVVTNLSSGGSRIPIDRFLRNEYPNSAESRKKQLENFALQLAKHLDDLQLENHGERLDELGIDIGIDQNNKIWIYEVNWRPGLPHALYGKTHYERTMLQYAEYLTKHSQP